MMKLVLLITLASLLHCEGAVVIRSNDEIVNERPIIGVLSQEQGYRLQELYPDQNYTSYIAASYVKDIEASGARVVPIMIGKKRSYYEDLLGKINGVFFPGGATYFNQPNGYADAGQHIYEIAQKLNDEGDYFPVYGTCLGFELLIILASGRGKVDNKVACHSYGTARLDFTNDFRSSKMFKNAPEDVIHLLATKRVTVNAHKFCILDENLHSHNLTDWRVTAHSNDSNGLQFIASIENKRYPFYGTQFHPEKSAFEWVLVKKYPHTADALKANRYFMDFFVNECRHNFHSFPDVAEEKRNLIYNYNPKFTGLHDSIYEQCYMFEPKGPLLRYVVASDETIVNDRPIIGVLSQEQSMYLHTKYPQENYTSYIAASYVKAVEAAGARVVPIMIGRNRSYYKDIMSKINGVVFPGGATYLNQSDGYADAGQHIYEIAKELNDAGDYFPIFGTCLGLQLIVILASGRGEQENRGNCYSFTNTPLEFIDDYRSTKMYKDAPEDVINNLATKDITVHAHQFCIFDENLKAYNLTEDWRVTAYSYDENGVKNIATMEHTRYPFYAVMFHPEKNSYEWKLSKRYAHSLEAVIANRYYMDFFGRECRKSSHSFASASEENKYLIYNHEPHFTGVLGSAFHQCYLFEPRGTVAK